LGIFILFLFYFKLNTNFAIYVQEILTYICTSVEGNFKKNVNAIS